MKKNDIFDIEITGMTDEGYGIGRINGMAVFVPYTIVGETVKAIIIKILKNYAVGKLIEVVKPSENRIKSDCNTFYQCGGCALRHMTYDEELRFKKQDVYKRQDRYTIDNSNVPTKSSVSESDQAELEEFIYNAKILVNALGHKAFEHFAENSNNTQEVSPVFQVSSGDGKAYGIQTSDGFVLLKNSHIHHNAADFLKNGIKKKVEQSKENGEIVNDILQIDKLFSSSSAAAAFAVGYSISGPQQWKTENGETLKSFETKKKK